MLLSQSLFGGQQQAGVFSSSGPQRCMWTAQQGRCMLQLGALGSRHQGSSRRRLGHTCQEGQRSKVCWQQSAAGSGGQHSCGGGAAILTCASALGVAVVTQLAPRARLRQGAGQIAAAEQSQRTAPRACGSWPSRLQQRQAAKKSWCRRVSSARSSSVLSTLGHAAQW